MVKYTPQSGIYVILNIKTGKVYIGQAQDFRRRWQDHKNQLRGNYHRNIHLQRAWNKYGEQAFKFQKLEYCSIEQLDKREQHYLNVYMAKGMCYNIAQDVIAPRRGLKHSEEARRKMSEANKQRAPVSEETRLRRSEAGKRRPPPSEETRRKMSESGKGKIRSEETRRRISEAVRRRPPMNDETRRKIGEAHKGKIVSDDTRHKLSEAQKQRSPTSDETRRKMKEMNKGRICSEGTRRKMSEAHKRKHAHKKVE